MFFTTKSKSVKIPVKTFDRILSLLATVTGTEKWDISSAAEGEKDLNSYVSSMESKTGRFFATLEEISSIMKAQSQSSKNLDTHSRDIRDQAVSINTQTGNVSESTQEMAQNMNAISSATEELSINMKNIADSAANTEKMIEILTDNTQNISKEATTIAEITRKTESITQRAKQEAQQTSREVESLGKATREIGDVTTTIADISDQTKLLALNATIEAARAGEAGKGFAVVAREVKDLAQQTNNATIDINNRITQIQAATHTTTRAMENITNIIQTLSSEVNAISESTQNQSDTMDNLLVSISTNKEQIEEMAHNVDQGAQAIQEVNVSVTDTYDLSETTRKMIHDIVGKTEIITKKTLTNYALSLETSSQGNTLEHLMENIPLQKRSGKKPALAHFTHVFDVGIADFNAEHRKIFAYINHIHDLIKSHGEQSKLLQVLKDLAEFTTVHFQHEEERMEEKKYPLYTQHKDIHDTLLNKVSHLITSIENNEDVDLFALLLFLRDWLYTHIQVEDMKYSMFFKNADHR
ncbi:MAG: bacteriohemerythrin [Fibrobacterota bacterium]